MQNMVREFHRKNGYKIDAYLREDIKNSDSSTILGFMSKMFRAMADSLKDKALQDQEGGDERLYRVWLMFEELTETIHALAIGDEVELADGLGDLLYVVFGTGVTYDIPLLEVFTEIHIANMAKKQRTADNPRMRDKGEGWQRPDLGRVINDVRTGNIR